MKKLLILTVVVCGMLTACSNNSKNESETTGQETMVEDSSLATDGATSLPGDTAVVDSATSAHGHSH